MVKSKSPRNGNRKRTEDRIRSKNRRISSPVSDPPTSPTVSVIIPSYNHEKYIGECIQSVLDQTYKDLEIIITDDGSSDRTVERIKHFTDPRIQLFQFPKNQGACAASNNCIRHAAGRYIAMISSDDAWYPQKIEVQVTYLDAHPEITAVFSKVDWMDESSRPVADRHFPYRNLFEAKNRSRFQWLRYFFENGNCLCHPSSLIRRECYQAIGLLNPAFASLPDLDLWIRMCLHYDIMILDQKLIRFRWISDRSNASGATKTTLLRNQFELRQELNHYLNIKKPSELLLIFPEAVQYGNVTEDTIPYILGRMAIRSGSEYKMLWGQEVIYSQLQNERRAQTLEEECNFTYRDFIRISGKCNPYRRIFAAADKTPDPPNVIGLGDWEHGPKELPDSVRYWISTAKESLRGGQFAAANDMLLHALDAAKQTQDPSLVIGTACTAGELLLNHGSNEFAVIMLDAALRIAKSVGDATAEQRIQSLLSGRKGRNPAVDRVPAGPEAMPSFLPAFPHRVAEAARFPSESDANGKARSVTPLQTAERKTISVIVTSFNHEKYINQCLESIWMQKGDFNLEIIFGDDSSTDTTREILLAYFKKYPHIIKMFPPGPNRGITKNLKRCLDMCTGEFIAICEGDDYWLDENKLQKQMEFLEEHKDYALCFSAIMLLLEEENRLVPHSGQNNLKMDTITTEDLIETNYIGNFSCCLYRTDAVRKLPAEIFNMYTVDWMFNMACGQVGKIGFLRNSMSVYRLHAQGAWSGKPAREQNNELLQCIDAYNKFFKYKYDKQFTKLRKGVLAKILEMDSEKELRNAEHG